MLPEQWSSTNYRKWLVGHIHHQNAIETDNGVFVEAFGTLAFPDSYHASHGYGASSVMTQLHFIVTEERRFVTFTKSETRVKSLT